MQIIDEWVLQRGCEGGKVVSGFRCDYEIQFEIVRKMSQVLLFLAKTPNRLGEPDGLRFIMRRDSE